AVAHALVGAGAAASVTCSLHATLASTRALLLPLPLPHIALLLSLPLPHIALLLSPTLPSVALLSLPPHVALLGPTTALPGFSSPLTAAAFVLVGGATGDLLPALLGAAAELIARLRTGCLTPPIALLRCLIAVLNTLAVIDVVLPVAIGNVRLVEVVVVVGVDV